MKLLRGASLISVLCTALILVFMVPPLLASGVVEVGGNVFELMVVLPTLIGLPCALIGAIVGIACIAQRRTRTAASIVVTAGQLITTALGAAITVWALNFGTTGWELLLLPFALIVGQIVVAAGLVTGRRKKTAA